VGHQQVTTQLITPNPDIPAEEGMCLQYVRQAFGLPMRYGSATEAWNNSPSQHPDRNYPQGVWFPVWWALDKNVNGHVALVAPDGSVYSTSNLAPNPVKHHPSIADVEAYYAYYGMTLTYRGWTEDVAGYPVISLDTGSIGFDSITTTPVQEDTVTPEQMDELKKFTQACVNDSINKMWETEGVTQTLVQQVAARLDRGIQISRNQAEDIVASTTARVNDFTGKQTAAPAPAVVDVATLAAQLAPLLNASQADAFMAAFKAQINK
jgi:hypothetical protein